MDPLSQQNKNYFRIQLVTVSQNYLKGIWQIQKHLFKKILLNLGKNNKSVAFEP